MDSYSDYQLNQFILKVFKQYKKVDKSVNLSVVTQEELGRSYFIEVLGINREVVMLMYVTGKTIGRKEVAFYFDDNGVFKYIECNNGGGVNHE